MGVRVLFSADTTCPDHTLEKHFPDANNSDSKYLNSGMFMGYASNINNILNYADPEDGIDDQMFYTLAYIDNTLREANAIGLDHYSKIFQNLNGTESKKIGVKVVGKFINFFKSNFR